MIHIFYRHYPVSGREDWRPDWFDYEKCFLNLLWSIGDKNNVKINVVYDGEVDDNFIFKNDLNFYHINAKSDYESFKKTFEIIRDSDIKDDEIIYLLENDYLHVKNWDIDVEEFIKINKDSYLSLYDHNDKYFEENSDLYSKIIVSQTHHFRTTPSTCGSFIATKKTLIEDYFVHYNSPEITKVFSNMPVDHAKFLLIKSLKNRDVYTPIPGLSTHCLRNLLSPTIKWENF